MWQTLRSEHRHRLQVPPPIQVLNSNLRCSKNLLWGYARWNVTCRSAVGALMVLSAIVLFFPRTAELHVRLGPTN